MSAGMDDVLNATNPLVRMPRYEKLPDLMAGQSRMVLGRQGLYAEARSEAVHARAMMNPFLLDAAVPLGDADTFVSLTGGSLPRELIASLIEEARSAMPNEWAAAVIWNGTSYEVHRPQVLSASRGRISYRASGIDPQRLVMDIHSHAAAPAFFSSVDDKDDRGNLSPCFIATVVGSLDQAQVTVSQRLVMNGRFYTSFDGLWAQAGVSA